MQRKGIASYFYTELHRTHSVVLCESSWNISDGLLARVIQKGCVYFYIILFYYLYLLSLCQLLLFVSSDSEDYRELSKNKTSQFQHFVILFIHLCCLHLFVL